MITKTQLEEFNNTVKFNHSNLKYSISNITHRSASIILKKTLKKDLESNKHQNQTYLKEENSREAMFLNKINNLNKFKNITKLEPIDSKWKFSNQK